ncbi:hypothetical protein J3R03_002808 [Actinoplanes couchii]|uniref:Uncharacterized protein n=1 Tax=Actinoplanes couchii TaxID=403638 RepID=A0ABQ3XNY1_9ACTN|nr:hypothetical protein [Actinoplanes couchii]GID60221.1 hypothetical protein Aco03nite_086250 [Actinoplanes couchii]
MRSVVHALRGWPTPLGVAINTSAKGTDISDRLSELTGQVLAFATHHRAPI